MKRLLILTLALALALLLCTCALAEGLDFASMTDEELNDALAAIQAELSARNGADTEQPESTSQENPVILDYDGLTVTVKDIHVDSDWLYGDASLFVDVVESNESDKKLGANASTVSINGWQVDGSAYFEIEAGKKAKDTFKFKMSDADISTLDEVVEVEFVFTVFDDNFNFYNQDPVSIHLK